MHGTRVVSSVNYFYRVLDRFAPSASLCSSSMRHQRSTVPHISECLAAHALRAFLDPVLSCTL